jgi:hypothetical protein
MKRQPRRDMRDTAVAYAAGIESTSPAAGGHRAAGAGPEEITMDRTTDAAASHRAHDELRSASPVPAGRGFAFPCNEAGDVDPAALSERARHGLARVLAAVGRERSAPIVQPARSAQAH